MAAAVSVLLVPVELRAALSRGSCNLEGTCFYWPSESLTEPARGFGATVPAAAISLLSLVSLGFQQAYKVRDIARVVPGQRSKPKEVDSYSSHTQWSRNAAIV